MNRDNVHRTQQLLRDIAERISTTQEAGQREILAKSAADLKLHMQGECEHEFASTKTPLHEALCKHCGVDEDVAVQVRQQWLQVELEGRRRALAQAGVPLKDLPLAMFVG